MHTPLLVLCSLVNSLTIFLVIEMLMKMSCILRMAEEFLLIAVCFSGSRGIVIVKCLCLCFQVATSECEIICGYIVEYTSGGNSEELASLANRMLESLTIRLCSSFHENNAEFIASWLI